MSRKPYSLLLTENCKLYLALIWWPVKCTKSQIPHLSKHIFNWSYFQVLFTVIHSSVPILLRKSKNNVAIPRNMLLMDPVWNSSPFYIRTIQSQTGTKVTRVGAATERKSDRSEFIFRPVPCKPMKRNVWRSIRTPTGLSSSRSHVDYLTHYVH